MSRYISLELVALVLLGLSQIMYGQALITNKAKRMAVMDLSDSKLDNAPLASDLSYISRMDEDNHEDEVLDDIYKTVMNNCLKHHRQRECVYQYMRVLISHMADQDKFPSVNEPIISNDKRDLKRNGNEKNNEILSILRNAIAKNIKLKSNIKTTRF